MIYLLFFSVILIIALVQIIAVKLSIKQSFHFIKLYNIIDWKKVFWYYLFFNLLSIISNYNNDQMTWVDVILIPILLTSFLITIWFTQDRDKRIEVDRDEFKKYEKEKKRQKKLDKLGI